MNNYLTTLDQGLHNIRDEEIEVLIPDGSNRLQSVKFSGNKSVKSNKDQDWIQRRADLEAHLANSM